MSVYRTRILAAVESGAIPAVPGGMTHVDIEHAKGCRADHGRRCICTPRITVIAGGEALTIGREGEITNRRAVAGMQRTKAAGPDPRSTRRRRAERRGGEEWVRRWKDRGGP